MSKEIIDYGFGVIETRETFYPEDVIRQKDQRIAELEEQLKNSIVPKFKIGQECYVLLGKVIEKIIIVGCRIKISKMEDENFTMYSITDIQGYACSVMEEQLFATKEEAQAKLKELKGENNEKV